MIEPEDVAEHVLRVLDSGREETFFPGWYRVPALVHAVAPGLLARLLARRRYRTMPPESE